MAKQLAKEHAGRLARVKGGLAHPDEAKWMEAEKTAIGQHVEDWSKSLQNRGGCDHHVRQSRDRVLRVFDLARIQWIGSLSVYAIESAMAELRQIKGRNGNRKLSDRTIHHHGRAARAFSRWLWVVNRSQTDNLAKLKLPKVVDSKERRALQPEEIAVLIETTRTQPTRAGIVGEDRSVLYATATGSGLRLGELQSLTPESFDLDACPATITCLGAYCKNGETAIQPITPELASLLRPWLQGKPQGTPVFVLQPLQIARALRKDLEAAGVIDRKSYAFYFMRHSYITAVVKSGCSVKVAQELARHADPKLTLSVYSHLTVADLTKGLEILSHAIPTPAVLTGLTGTDGEGGGIAEIPSPGRSGTDLGGLPGKCAKGMGVLVRKGGGQTLPSCLPQITKVVHLERSFSRVAPT
jgi:site-specific recombinase XerC